MQRDLADRATAGDHAAFAELASDAIGRLYRVAYLILRDTDAANDAVQNALIAAWRGVRGLRDPDRFTHGCTGLPCASAIAWRAPRGGGRR